MKAPGGNPVLMYSIPPARPDQVEELYLNFDRIGDEIGALEGEIADQEEAGQAAVRAAQAKAVEAVMTGKTTKVDPAKVEAEEATKLATLHARKAVLFEAIDEAGNDLAVGISTHRADWISNLRAQENTAARFFDIAIVDAKAALADLAPVRAAVEWLETFEHTKAIRNIGDQHQFSGGRLLVEGAPGIGQLSGTLSPSQLLDLAAKATAPPEPPRVRTGLKVAAPAGSMFSS